MSKPKLVYFDIHGARGEAARLAMAIGGVPFEDDRVKFPDWESRQPSTPFGALPVLELNGQTVAQSNGINRYVGKLAGLYPGDAWQAALCDEAMDAVEEIVELLQLASIDFHSYGGAALYWDDDDRLYGGHNLLTEVSQDGKCTEVRIEG